MAMSVNQAVSMAAKKASQQLEFLKSVSKQKEIEKRSRSKPMSHSKLEILKIIREVNLESYDAIVQAASAIYIAQCDFCRNDSRLIEIPDPSYSHLDAINPSNHFDHYDIDLPNLAEKFEKDVQELLWYCARIGVEVV